MKNMRDTNKGVHTCVSFLVKGRKSHLFEFFVLLDIAHFIHVIISKRHARIVLTLPPKFEKFISLGTRKKCCYGCEYVRSNIDSNTNSHRSFVQMKPHTAHLKWPRGHNGERVPSATAHSNS